MKAQEQQEKESRRLAALKLRQEGDIFVKQNMLREAISKYRQSLTYWPDTELEKYVQTLETRVAALAATVPANTGRSYTSRAPGERPASTQFYGEYSGNVTGGGVAGKITITISKNNEVAGTVSGTLNSDPCSASLRGAFNPSSGTIQASIQGSVTTRNPSGKYSFIGEIRGQYRNNLLTGEWNATNRYDNVTGLWNAALQKAF